MTGSDAPVGQSSGGNARPHIAPASLESGPSGSRNPWPETADRRIFGCTAVAIAAPSGRPAGRAGVLARPGVLSAHGREGRRVGRGPDRGDRRGADRARRRERRRRARRSGPPGGRARDPARPRGGRRTPTPRCSSKPTARAPPGTASCPSSSSTGISRPCGRSGRSAPRRPGRGRSSSPSATGCCGPPMRSSRPSPSAIARSSGSSSSAMPRPAGPSWTNCSVSSPSIPRRSAGCAGSAPATGSTPVPRIGWSSSRRGPRRTTRTRSSWPCASGRASPARRSWIGREPASRCRRSSPGAAASWSSRRRRGPGSPGCGTAWPRWPGPRRRPCCRHPRPGWNASPRPWPGSSRRSGPRSASIAAAGSTTPTTSRSSDCSSPTMPCSRRWSTGSSGRCSPTRAWARSSSARSRSTSTPARTCARPLDDSTSRTGRSPIASSGSGRSSAIPSTARAGSGWSSRSWPTGSCARSG